MTEREVDLGRPLAPDEQPLTHSATGEVSHRFTATSKQVYPKPVVTGLRRWFDEQLALQLPMCRVLYWT